MHDPATTAPDSPRHGHCLVHTTPPPDSLNDQRDRKPTLSPSSSEDLITRRQGLSSRICAVPIPLCTASSPPGRPPTSTEGHPPVPGLFTCGSPPSVFVRIGSRKPGHVLMLCGVLPRIAMPTPACPTTASVGGETAVRDSPNRASPQDAGSSFGSRIANHPELDMPQRQRVW